MNSGGLIGRKENNWGSPALTVHSKKMYEKNGRLY